MKQIKSKDLFGKSKHGMAIERIRQFCDGKRVLVAFSGGKDSQCIYHLCEDAGIEFHAEYSITRFEPPELVRFIRDEYPSVTFRRAYAKSLVEEIGLHGLPNMFARWCCKAKHMKTEGYDIVLIGIRWEESARRRETWRMMGYKQDHTAYLCPIVDWTTGDVWEYLADRPHCKLYDEGFSRIGCVCCPLVPRRMMADAERWPKTAAMLRQGANAYVRRMRAQGYVTKRGNKCASWCAADNPEAEYFWRWLTTGQTAKDYSEWPEDDECLFAGTGFSEADAAPTTF